MTRTLLIGVDVGGTNTDSVLIDPHLISNPTQGVLSWNKAVTTKDVSFGIQEGISKLFADRPDIPKEDVCSVTIGTTHFINAVIEQDEARLAKVAVLRLSGPYGRQIPPFSDFPVGLRDIMEGYVGTVSGGYHVDGREIGAIDEQEILKHVEEIKLRGIKAVALVGVFASLNPDHEIRAQQIILNQIPDAKVVLSHQISGVGFIERENASILNASILPFAETIIFSFIAAVENMGLSCPVLLTQNDGTVLSAYESLKSPIRTFSSGTTNSMRGASFLGNIVGQTAIVVDVGGTTADVGLLLPNGFPRQSSSYSTVGGVRINFSMPHVESMGLGGGSLVKEIDGEVFVGPESVGAEILQRSVIFGGSDVTASDVAVASDLSLDIGDQSKVQDRFNPEFISKFKVRVERMLENVVDRMKTNPDDVTVLAVGGGSFIVPEKLKGASSVIRPQFYNVANAIGAAMGKISSEVQCFMQLTDITKEEILEDLKKKAVDEAVKKGALLSSVETVFVSAEPIPYVANTFEFTVKTISDVDYDTLKSGLGSKSIKAPLHKPVEITKRSAVTSKPRQISLDDVDYVSYRPLINDERQWVISEVDLELLRIGTYILGCGGGGEPYPFYLAARDLLRNGEVLLVVDVKDIEKYTGDDGLISTICCAGSPTVSNEQLEGPGMIKSLEIMDRFVGKSSKLVFPVEIGGSNGLCPFRISSRLNMPVVDCDLMGRAYPTHWQTIPTAMSTDDVPVYPPTIISNGNGNTVIVSESKSDFLLEKVLRASLAEIGCTVDLVNPPMSADDVKKKTIHGSLSLAWRIGRAVRVARQNSEVYRMPEVILESVNNSGKFLFKGKIVGVERKLFKGHVWGEVTIEDLNDHNLKMVIPFKNENIYASVDGTVVCSVPDLIAVIDSETGEAVGTPDYRYGLIVFVLGIAPSTKWTDTERALSIGGPKGFDLDDMPYNPVSAYNVPVSVIDEYC